ncbi:hypothetical protein F4818DRAFT_436500 [Hypoxylon cercidicola]|nr:hypothetical protein F4818DRAFT_436500 [Hypoxylon cercidicola]
MPDRRPCYLGALAPELVEHILSQFDSISALGNFITSCRYVHGCFKRQQEHLVFHVLSNELGPVLVDARFLCKFPYADHGDSRQEWTAYWDGLHTSAEIRYGPPAGTAPLSRAERLRTLRAFYRRQIVCNAWAPTKREPCWTERDVAAISNTSDHQGVPLGLFAAFEPWELQQIDHVNHFVARLCAALTLVGEEEGQEADFGEIFSHMDELTRYLRSHSKLAEAALRALPSLPRLTSRALLDAAPAYSQLSQRYCLPCLRYAWQASRLDRFPDPARDRKLPPFGWVDGLDGSYVNWFGEALHSEVGTSSHNSLESSLARHDSLELWTAAGFALWDRWRVEAIKELDQTRQLRTGWIVH